jgi:nicotinamide N-methyltransferase
MSVRPSLKGTRSLLPAGSNGFDVVFLSDLLHFNTSHGALLTSLRSLLARTPYARAYVGAGKYTAAAVCADWVRAADAVGLAMDEVLDGSAWAGQLDVVWSGTRLDAEALTTRKQNCRLWVGRWANLA